MDIAELYRRYATMVLRRVLRFYPRDEAEEIVHEVFLRVVERAASFRAESSPTTWLYQVTTNHCLNRLRNDSRRRALLIRHHAWSPPRASHPPDQVAAVFLQQLWRELDEETAAIAVYYFVDDMSHAEIANVVGVSRRTVGNRIEDVRTRARAHRHAGAA